MSDEVIGISVLQPIWADGFYRLWIHCRKSSGNKGQTWIFVRDRERTDLPKEVPKYEGKNPIWRFRRQGHLLVVEPSVNWISWGFHNQGEWMTEFVEMSAREELTDTHESNLPRTRRGSLLHYELNLCTTQEDVDRYLDELERAGAILT